MYIRHVKELYHTGGVYKLSQQHMVSSHVRRWGGRVLKEKSDMHTGEYGAKPTRV